MTAVASTPSEARRLTVLGVVYLLVIALLVWLSIASYRHLFADDLEVEVRAGNAGQQLNVGGDVRMNGTIVGRVSAVDAGPRGARITLQLDRAAAARIPVDVTARILPTTLFGQKYVELRSSSDPAAGHLREGSLVAEDRSKEAVELTTILDDLQPVLTAVRPDALALTLGALANGLDGRGASLHDLFEGGGAYLHALNARAPVFERDLQLFSRVSGQYAEVAPVIMRLLKRWTLISAALTGDRDAIARFTEAVGDASVAGRTLLVDSRQVLDESARLARPTTELLAEYSPELVCVLGGFLQVEKGSAAQVRDHSVQGYFTVGKQVPGYDAADRLRLGDVGAGPHCRGNPVAPIPYPAFWLDDGVTR